MNIIRPFKTFDWTALLRTASVEKSTVVLTRRHIYILPSRFGLMFALVVLLMLVGSINYALNLGFIMTFLLAGLGNVVMLHAWKNLYQTEIQALDIINAHAGNAISIVLRVTNPSRTPKLGLGMQCEGGEDIAYVDVPSEQSTELVITLPCQKRGRYITPRIKIHTGYPLGLFYVWSYAHIAREYFVYPTPIDPGYFPDDSLYDTSTESKRTLSRRGDEFDGHRPYRRGDSPRQIDWKASSKQTEWLIKETGTHAQPECHLRWQDTHGQDKEAKLSQLCFWVLAMHEQQVPYGLDIPGVRIAPSNGEAHKQACLKALAIF